MSLALAFIDDLNIFNLDFVLVFLYLLHSGTLNQMLLRSLVAMLSVPTQHDLSFKVEPGGLP